MTADWVGTLSFFVGSIKYFGFVGSALVLLLIGSGWCFPQPPSEPPGAVTERPAIRIASAERLPEPVIIDTSLPTIVSPPNVLEFAKRWPQATVAEVNPVPKPATPARVNDVSPKQNFAKRERSKKAAVQSAAWGHLPFETKTFDEAEAACDAMLKHIMSD